MLVKLAILKQGNGNTKDATKKKIAFFMMLLRNMEKKILIGRFWIQYTPDKSRND